MSLLTDLFSTLDKGSVSEIADALGESSRSAVTSGLQSAIAAVMGGLASKSDNPNVLRQALDLAPSAAGSASWSNVAGAIAGPNSPAASTGKRILSTLFGGAEGLVTRALGNDTGLPTGKVSTLMAAAGPMVMSFLTGRVRGEGLSMLHLGHLLQGELPGIRSVLPPSVMDLLSFQEHSAIAVSAGSQAASGTRSSLGWLLPLLLLAVVPALIWIARSSRDPVIQAPPAQTGTANRATPETATTLKRSLPANLDLYFESGSMKLRPESQAKLQAFAGALESNPDAHILVNGYTDNVGSAAGNMRLSQDRASVVKADLVAMGISAERLSAQGFGQKNPVADNGTPQGREANRRVSVGLGER